MDPITTAILAALASGPSGITTAPYRALRDALRQSFGPNSDLMAALDLLEKKPDSTGRQELFQEELAVATAVQNPELLNLAQELLNAANRQEKGDLPPVQYPPRAARFTGRQAELARLLGSLQPGRVAALYGPGGVGKSALAAEAVWQLAPNAAAPALFPNGIIYLDFYQQPRVDVTLEQITRLFGDFPTPTAYEAAQRIFAGRQLLLILDGADYADDLPGLLAVCGPQCGVLVISREAQNIAAEQQEIEPLPPDEAVRLLQPGRSGTTAAAAQEICKLVGYLPLTIQLVKQYLTARPAVDAAHYLEWLQKTHLTDLTPAQRRRECLPVLVERSLSHVSHTARQALAITGLLAPAPFDQGVIAGTLAIKTNQGVLAALRGVFSQKPEEHLPDVNLALHELVNFGLLRPVNGRYQIGHPLLHRYAGYMSAPARAVRRLATYYVAWAWEQSALGYEGLARLDADRPHIMRILAECLKSEEWQAAHGLAVAIEDYLDRQSYWAERVTANEAGLIASWQLGRANEEAWLSNLGDAYRIMGHTKWAIEHFEKALATARRTGNLPSQGNSLGNLGLAYRDLGQLDQAKSHLRQALAIFERINSPSAELVRDWLAELEEIDSETV